MTTDPTYRYPTSVEELLQRWAKRSRESQLAHYAAADGLSSRHRWMGVPAIVLSTIVASAAVGSVRAPDAPTWAKLAVGFVSGVAAVLTALQTFLGDAATAERHRAAGAKFGAIRRLIEQRIAESDYTSPVDSIREALDDLAFQAPQVSSDLFDRMANQSESANGAGART